MNRLQHALINWKTSVGGFLSFVIATGAVITAEPSHFLPPKWSGAATVAVALAKVWIGLISSDAGTVAAIPAQGGQPQAMPSTEVPLQAGAVVVTDKENQ